MKTKKFKLKNGLPVLMIENHKSPVVSVQMWVKTGSADEKMGEEGISHFIEHLVFKGTRKYGVGEIASKVEAAGGELNAYTSFDQTVFYVTISKEFVDTGLDVIVEMMGFPKFDPTEIDNEREVVIEEIKRTNDNPSRQASRLLFSTAYQKHPYGRPVIGYDKVVRKVSSKVLKAYYESRYVPKNMLLVVAGDVDAPEMRKKITRIFSEIPTHRLRAVRRAAEPAQKTSRVRTQKAPFEEAQFYLSWKVPAVDHADVAALDVLALILGQGDSSRLARKLRLEQALTTAIGAGTFTPKDRGLFTISGTLETAQLPKALEVITQELERIFVEPPSAEEMKKAIVNLESEEFYGLETVDGLARKAGSLETLLGDPNYFQKFLQQVHRLRPHDITRVARKYLVPQTLSAVYLSPQEATESRRQMAAWQKKYAQVYARVKRQKLAETQKSKSQRLMPSVVQKVPRHEDELMQFQLPNGGRLIVRPDHSTPVVSLRAGFLGGMRLEPAGKDGLTDLLSRIWTSGTKKWNEEQLNQSIEMMAGGLSAFGGRNSVGLSMQFLGPFVDHALDLFDGVLTEPTLPESALEREKTIMLQHIRSREDNPSQVASQLFMQSLFREHAYSRDMLGSDASVRALSRPDVSAHFEKMVRAGNLLIAVAGSVDAEALHRRLSQIAQRLPKGAKPEVRQKHIGPAEEARIFQKIEREQTHIILGYKGLALDDPRRYALQVAQSILAGQGGRLFMELRDKASMAYSVSPLRMEGIETGYFGAYIGCSPEKGERAIAMLRAEFDKLAQHAVGTSELERAKRYLIGRHDIDLQRNAAISSSILFNEIYGLPAQETFQYADSVRPVTAKDVQEIAQSLFSQPMIISAVGSVAPW